jgi:hypothetical protein
MPKKSRRSKAKRRAKVAQVVGEGRAQQSEPLPVESESSTRVSTKAQDFTSRYQYVMPEIKRIGIIAGAIILFLIIISFVGIPGG